MTKLYKANTKSDFIKIESNLLKKGFIWATDFEQPKAGAAYDTAKNYYHGNAHIYIKTFYNTITGKNEMQTTTLSITKTYKHYKKWIKTNYGFKLLTAYDMEA